MTLSIILFVVGLVLLIKGGDWFVDAATGIAHYFHVSEILIGATVVSIGTTLPEVMVSATSALQGHGDIAYGNAIGSVICNTALIAAITLAIRPPSIDRKTYVTPVLFFFFTAIFYALIAYTTQNFSRLVGCGLLLIFVIYIISSILQAKRQPSVSDVAADNASDYPLWKHFVWLVVGALLIAGGAKLLVDNAILIAQKAGVPESVIALTFVALGTSLPELVTAITSLVKGHSSLSLGNIVGANLFNLALVSGTSIVLSPFNMPQSQKIAGMPVSLLVDLPLMFAVMLVMTIPALCRGKFAHWQGILLLLTYVSYCVFLFAI